MTSKASEAQKKAINLQYLPSLTVKNSTEFIKKSAQRSARVRRQIDCHIDVAYGDTARQVLDIFPAQTSGAPVHVFIHGGYWRNTLIGKSDYSHVALPMVRAGATAILIEYDLCPDVRITDIVDQVRAAIKWIHRNIADYNGDRKQIYVSGHSAGGHLTAMLGATDWSAQGRLPKDLIKGVAPLSGLFDIEPHSHSDLQTDIRLTSKEIKSMSPMYLVPQFTGKALVAVGANESDSFHWQSLAYAAHLRSNRIRAEYLSTPDDNHFTITDRLGNRRDPLTKALIVQMGL